MLKIIHNRKFFELLGNGQLRSWIDHPFITGEKLFMWFDPTHNLKNLFNIWSSKKRFSLPPCETREPHHIFADFRHVTALQELEATKPVKVAHSLTSSSLYPSNIQKTSPKFALSKSSKDFLYCNNVLYLQHNSYFNFLTNILISVISLELPSLAGVFNETVVRALRHYGLPHWNETAAFIEYHLNLWKVLNVKSVSKGRYIELI